MPFSVSRLRKWFAAGAIVMIAIVAGMYIYARWRVRNALRELPQKIGVEISQTAEGFSISKSDQGRTLFTVSAAKAVQFKQGGRAELHDVKIVVYGRDTSRFDRITGSDFEFDPATGDVTARGPVAIDLQSNPKGLLHPDQAPPSELKNPIHIEASGLRFNRNTGNASVHGRVIFQTPQASGSAVGINYVANTGTLNLLADISVDIASPQQAHLTADSGEITKTPRQFVLTRPRMSREPQQLSAEKATFFLRDDNTVDHVLAVGQVEAEIHGRAPNHTRADQAELMLADSQNVLRTAVLRGNVQLVSTGDQPGEASAGKVTLRFNAKQELQLVHAEEQVRLFQKKVPTGEGPARPDPSAQEVELTASAMDLTMKSGNTIDRAETKGPPQIVIRHALSDQRTTITAGQFAFTFAARNRLASLHGSPDARIVSSAPGQPDRVSTSQTLDIAFQSTGGIASIVQQGAVAYTDGSRKATGERATYTAPDQSLAIEGAPRISDNGLTTTARLIRFNRATGDARGEGDVKSTYSELKAQPDGALLASADPIHVTSRNVIARRATGIAVYGGNARLWQNANVVEAQTIEFDREHRSLVARGTLGRPVSTVLVQTDKNGRSTPVTITSPLLTYIDSDRKIVLEGGVLAKGSDVTMTSSKMTVFLRPRGTGSAPNDSVAPEQLDRIVAEGAVVITQLSRRATGGRLEYKASEDRFDLTGGPPSIFDAEHGKITGDSLTFFRRDDRVLVEGRETSPTTTRTRVAR